MISNLRPLPGDVTAFAYTAVQLDRMGWQMATFVQVDARHKRKAAARDLAERARQLVVGLGELRWPAGVITYVQCIEGPFWLPDPEDGMPRYCARYELRAHPNRAPRPAAL